MPEGHVPLCATVALPVAPNTAAAPLTVSFTATFAIGVDAVPAIAVPVSITGAIAAVTVTVSGDRRAVRAAYSYRTADIECCRPRPHGCHRGHCAGRRIQCDTGGPGADLSYRRVAGRTQHRPPRHSPYRSKRHSQSASTRCPPPPSRYPPLARHVPAEMGEYTLPVGASAAARTRTVPWLLKPELPTTSRLPRPTSIPSVVIHAIGVL